MAARRRSLRARILAAFLLSFAFFLGAIGYGLVEFRHVGQALEVIDAGYVPLSTAARRMEASLVRLEIDLDRADPIELRRVAAHRSRAALHHGIIAERADEALEALEAVRPLATDAETAADLDRMQRQLDLIGELNASLEQKTSAYLDLAEQGLEKEAKVARPGLVNARRELETALSQLTSAVDGRIRRLAEETAQAQRTALIVSGGLSLAALMLGSAMLLLATIALRPIGRMTEEVRRIGEGHYEVDLDVSSGDELALLAERINAMAAAIRQRDEDLRRRAEDELRQRDRLNRAERLALVGQMLAQITHEVRNPLNAMSLNAELLAEDMDALPPERRAEALAMLGTVRSEIARLEATTEHYLTLARRPAPTLESQDPGEVVRGVAILLDEQLRRRDVELTLDVPALDPVELDANQLRQALLNVVRNASEAGASSIRIEVRRDEDDLTIAVCDDGDGLSREDAERAFDPFFTTKANGSGIGLAITRQILEDHGGTVRLDDVEEGTRLVLRIPA
ncbi:MAG: HAMP domain-containing protein [Proteobacteria bacterium]|nr:HAMP domain-containing protein [Pseudomonadota bacterium]MCP4921786.1 HAMP domain-containing protein [Pseudomonadota bacterium]